MSDFGWTRKYKNQVLDVRFWMDTNILKYIKPSKVETAILTRTDFYNHFIHFIMNIKMKLDFKIKYFEKIIILL